MATIASLDIALRARTGQFNRGMKSASRTLSGFGGSVNRVIRRVGVLGSAALAAAAGGGIALLTKQSLDSIDAMGKLSDRLGLSTESLAGFQHAASLAGVDSGALSTALGKVLRLVGELKDGSNIGADALRNLGLTSQQLTDVSPEQAILLMSDAFKNISDPAIRAAAAVDLFGRGGQQLLPFLTIGAQGLADAAVEVDKLGISFSRIDAAQVEEANDNIEKMQSIFNGLANTLAIELSPFLTAATQQFIDWATSGEGAAVKVTQAFEKVLGFVAELGRQFDRIKAIFGVMKASVEGLLALIGATPGAAGIAAKIFGVDLPTFQDAANTFNKALDSFDKFEAGTTGRGLITTFDAIQKKAEDSAKALHTASLVRPPIDPSRIANFASGTDGAALTNATQAKGLELINRRNIIDEIIQKRTAELAALRAGFRAERIGKELAEKKLTESPAVGDQLGRGEGFRQIDPKLISIPGLTLGASLTEKELKTQSNLLQLIEKNTRNQSAGGLA